MIRVERWTLPASLVGHVAAVWRMSGAPAEVADYLLPDVGGADLAIHLGDPSTLDREGAWVTEPQRLVVGALGRALGLRHGRRVDTIGIHLPAGCACLLGAPASALCGVVASLRELAPALDEALARWSADFVAGRVGREGLFAALAAHLRPRCDGLVRRAVGRLMVGDEEASVAHAAADLGLSRRQLARRVQQSLGRSPREFRRVARFAHAWWLAWERRASWATIAAEAGYCDQAHLAREFRALAGAAPSAVFSAAWYAGQEAEASDVPSIQAAGEGAALSLPACRTSTERSQW